MSIMEVLLLVLGAAILTVGYFLPDKNGKSSRTVSKEQEDQIRELIDQEMEDARERIEDIVDETVNYSMEKAERSMERLSNEKIMAIDEYSDTVLQEIHKNHEEAVFLYDMLNNKHETIMSTVSEAGKTLDEMKQSMQDVQASVKEAVIPAKDAFVPIQAVEVKDMDSVLKTVEYVEPTAAQREVYSALDIFPRILVGNEKAAEEYQWSEAAEDDMYASPDDPLYNGDQASAGNNNDRILELHKAGMSNVAIAKELGLGIGEVKLVIDLYKGTAGRKEASNT